MKEYERNEKQKHKRTVYTHRKKRVNEFVKKNNIDTSNLVLSSVMAYIQSEENTPASAPSFTEQVRLNMVRNKLINAININPEISDSTKEYLYKELMKL